MLDEFLPKIEQMKKEGAVVVLKWDGERSSKEYTVVISRADTNFLWRADSADLIGSLTKALADYKARHSPSCEDKSPDGRPG